MWIFFIVSLVAALFFLISGKVKFGKTVYLEGPRARMAGLIFLVPVALILLLLVVENRYESTGNVSDLQTFERTMNSLANALMLNGFMIGLAYINFHSVSREARERGGCLTYSLAYFIFITLMLIWFLRSGSSTLTRVLIGISILQIIFVLGIWLWKKWGVFGFAILSMLSPVTAYLNSGSVFLAFTSLLLSLSTLLALYLLIKPKWQFFD
jgi:hypothetical protein